MRLATLQIASVLGDVQGNIKKADELLRNARVKNDGEGGEGVPVEDAKLDILVLPELIFTGYNFPSLESIKPYLEPAGKGPSAEWARKTAQRLGCKVCVGYPEIETDEQGNEKFYNALLVVDEKGSVLLNYRKTFLYYTDETWASEGSAELGFHQLTFPKESPSRPQGEAAILPPPPESTANAQAKTDKEIATSFGICMDINPYKFEAPYSAFEFAHRVLDSKSQLVILSMAWLTLLSREEVDALAGGPALETFNYWVQRFMPLLRKQMQHTANADADGDSNPDGEKNIILVFANRAGEEDGGAPPTSLARYAGTSTIIAISQRPKIGVEAGAVSGAESSSDDEQSPPLDVKILCWDMLGAREEGLCFADTEWDPKMVFQLARRAV
ncbi:carbon-nitrogen hydrolase [Aspergillus venezuelensis]